MSLSLKPPCCWNVRFTLSVDVERSFIFCNAQMFLKRSISDKPNVSNWKHSSFDALIHYV